MPPRLTILVPTYGRAEFLRGLLARLGTQIARLPAGTVELLVSDNHSADHTPMVLAAAGRSFPFLRVVSPPRHVPSAEENLAFALPYCRGEHVWPFGDDDEPEDGAIARVLDLLAAHRPDVLVLNPRLIAADGAPIRDRAVKMRQPVLDWPFDRLVAAIGFKGLAACFTAMVMARAPLDAADWAGHLKRSPIYAHVALFLDAFRDRRCVMVDEPLVSARQGGTGMEEFRRFAAVAEVPLLHPWVGGLLRHLHALTVRGIVPPDFPGRVVEPEADRRVRLLPYILIKACEQLCLWLDGRQPSQSLSAEDVDLLGTVLASGIGVEREAGRRLCETASVVASLLPSPVHPGLPAAHALELLTADERAAFEAPLAGWARDRIAAAVAAQDPRSLTRTVDYRAAVSLLDILGGNGRNAAPGKAETASTLAGLLATVPPAVAAMAADALAAALRRRTEGLAAGIEARIDPALQADGRSTRDGYEILPLGGVVVGIRGDHVLTASDIDDLDCIDPAGCGSAILVADGEAALYRQIGEQPAPADAPDAELFLGYRLSLWRGRHVAVPVDRGTAGDGNDGSLSIVGDRTRLRAAVLAARRAADPAFTSMEDARARIAAAYRPEELLGVFDAEWYCAANPGVESRMRQLGCDALTHFCVEGSAAGLSPGIWFDESWYRTAHPLVARGIAEGAWDSGLHHWLGLGRALGLSPILWFDADGYCAAHPEVMTALSSEQAASPLDHYRTVGAARGWRPFDLFDPRWYVETYPDAAAAVALGQSPLEHFLRHGRAAGYGVGPDFDDGLYLATNPDVAEAIARGVVVGALQHWLQFGRQEGRRGGRVPRLARLRRRAATNPSGNRSDPGPHGAGAGRT